MMSAPFTGLSTDEAIEQRKLYGSNIIKSKDNGSLWYIIKGIITEPLFFILIITAVLYVILGQESEATIMILALFFVSGISLFQESRSRNAVNSLKKLSNAKVKVIRDGTEQYIETEDLVVGDVFLAEDGNIIPADGIVLESNDFSVDESMLTGESLPVFKVAGTADNHLKKGTLVVSGACTGQVKAVGNATSMGQIGQRLEEIKEVKTPLQIQIAGFIRTMVLYGVVAFILVWTLNYVQNGGLVQSLLKGLTLAMSVLPEEIPVAFSTFMALGAYHLYRKGVIARSPYTVEVLGAATVICTDKTGTLTENKMEIASIFNYADQHLYDFTQQGYAEDPVLTYAMWASEVVPFDNMEKSIHEIYGKVSMTDRRKEYSMYKEYPLSGTPPIMTHVFKNQNDHLIIAVKGSIEGVLRQCSLSEEIKFQIFHQSSVMAQSGYRVLAVGRAEVSAETLPLSQHDFEYEFLGLIAFYDPPKKNISAVLEGFYKAGIDVKMVTGDHAQTALSIARQVGLKNGETVMTGDEVMAADAASLKKAVKSISVFARMYPDAKLKLIEALKSNEEVVAMTGDGVNDGPALKAAHIGIAMGQGGSEVAKKAASLILMDDDLKWMMDAVALGRRIYENLKKAIMYIISIHIPIILIVALPLVLSWSFTDIFSPIHVIFLELIMGPTCSIIFENEPIERNSMRKPPRKMGTNLFSFKEMTMSILQGLVITVTCLGIGYIYMSNGSNETLVRTVIYSTLIFSNIFLTLVNRSFYYSILTTIKYKNHLIPLIILASLVVLLISIYVEPVQYLFRFQALSGMTLLYCLATALSGVLWVEGYKWYIRKK